MCFQEDRAILKILGLLFGSGVVTSYIDASPRGGGSQCLIRFIEIVHLYRSYARVGTQRPVNALGSGQRRSVLDLDMIALGTYLDQSSDLALQRKEPLECSGASSRKNIVQWWS